MLEKNPSAHVQKNVEIAHSKEANKHTRNSLDPVHIFKRASSTFNHQLVAQYPLLSTRIDMTRGGTTK